MEIDYRWQKSVDKYAADPTPENKAHLFRELPYVDPTKAELVNIIEAAVQQGLSVVCLDNRNPEVKILRDEYMKSEIDKVVQQGGRLAVFVGTAHIRWAKQSQYNYETTGNVMRFQLFKPLGRFLVDEYGKDKIGIVNLMGCYDSYVFACVTE